MMVVIDKLFSKLFLLKERFAHPLLRPYFKQAIRYERMTYDELHNVVCLKLERLLRYAAEHVPYYREWFKAHPNTGTLQLADFPLITKSDIRGHETEFVSDEYDPAKLEKTRTSGSTGEPFMFYRDPVEWDASYAVLWRGLMRFGIRPGDKRVLVKGVDETASVSLVTRVKRMVYGWVNRCIVIDAHFLAKSEENILAEIQRMISYRPDFLHGYVSSIYLLARTAEEHGIDLARLKVKAVVTESEKCHPFQRELIERIFAAPVVENYGCVEFGMIAQPAKDGAFCINDDHVFVEADEDGNAILTNLDARAFPLIRFKNGDKIKLGKCHPILPYRMIDSLDGRSTEMIRLPQGGALHGFIPMYPISKHSKWMSAYQIYQPSIDRLIIRIVLTGSGLPDEIQNQIISEMREIVGDVIKIEFEFPTEIPLSRRGKRLFICSDVKE